MTKPMIILFERGINGFASIFGDWKNWPNQAIVWWHNEAVRHGQNWRGQTLEYFTGPLFAGLTRRHRARQFSKLILAYANLGWDIMIVAHSEGTATVLAALRAASWPAVKSLHLICGACDADFDRNGLNWALKGERIGRVICYLAGQDSAMKLENTMPGKFLFLIRQRSESLGLTGPKNVNPFVLGKTQVRRWPGYGHSSCFEKHNFDTTMLQILENSRLTP